MYRARLRKLADFLTTVPDYKFNMNSWVSPCGTTACAGGWAGLMPEFQKLGLKSHRATNSICLHDMRNDSFAALETFFGLTNDQASELFLPTYTYHTREHVIARIRSMIRVRKKATV